MIALLLPGIGSLLSLRSFPSPLPAADKNDIVYATANEIRALLPDVLYPVLKGDSQGTSTPAKNGLSPIYNEATDFVVDRAVGLRPLPSPDNVNVPRLSLIDKTGKLFIPCVFQRLEYGPEGLVRAQKTQRWGFTDGQGRVIVPFQYEDADPFRKDWPA